DPRGDCWHNREPTKLQRVESRSYDMNQGGDVSPSPQRSNAASAAPSGVTYRFKDCEVDPASYRLLVKGEVVAIEPRVFELVVYLIEHRDRVVSKEELFERLWAGKYVTESTLTRAVYEARRALGDDSRQQHIIKTLHSRGYQFVAAVHEDRREERADEPHTQSSTSDAPADTSEAAPPLTQSTGSGARRWLPMAVALLVVAAIVIAAATWNRGGSQAET